MSMYDSIKTAAELVAEVQAHGLSSAQEDICRAQDIFGHTAVKELARLANDIGQNNDKGEPDPNGTRSSGRRGTQSTFYSILVNIWHWEEVTRFWNLHTNPERQPWQEAKRTIWELQHKVMATEIERDAAKNLLRTSEKKASDHIDLICEALGCDVCDIFSVQYKRIAKAERAARRGAQISPRQTGKAG